MLTTGSINTLSAKWVSSDFSIRVLYLCYHNVEQLYWRRVKTVINTVWLNMKLILWEMCKTKCFSALLFEWLAWNNALTFAVRVGKATLLNEEHKLRLGRHKSQTLRIERDRCSTCCQESQCLNSMKKSLQFPVCFSMNVYLLFCFFQFGRCLFLSYWLVIQNETTEHLHDQNRKQWMLGS